MTEIARVDISTGEIVDESGPVQQGRDAWGRIKERGKRLREDWLLVAEALNVGRKKCIADSGGLNKKAFGQWCKHEGFDDMDFRERSSALWMLDNWDSIIGNADITFENPTHVKKQFKALEKQDKLEQAKIDKAERDSASVDDNRPTMDCEGYAVFLDRFDDRTVDLLITDPPYSTDVDDIGSFVADWLPWALDKVKDDGRAYICIGAYPKEVHAYLDFLLRHQDRFTVDNPLVWTYKNTLGQTPKDRYNLNYQIILHLYTELSGDLDTSITNEMFAVQEINAPDGRIGDRYHSWQKPDELANRLIRHSSAPGDLVIDPFACTGSFLLAAARSGCVAHGCDIDQNAVGIALDRGCVNG